MKTNLVYIGKIGFEVEDTNFPWYLEYVVLKSCLGNGSKMQRLSSNVKIEKVFKHGSISGNHYCNKKALQHSGWRS